MPLLTGCGFKCNPCISQKHLVGIQRFLFINYLWNYYTMRTILYIEWGAPISPMRCRQTQEARCVCFSHNFLLAVCAFLLYWHSAIHTCHSLGGFAYWFLSKSLLAASLFVSLPFSSLFDSNKVRYCEIWCDFVSIIIFCTLPFWFLFFFCTLLYALCSLIQWV